MKSYSELTAEEAWGCNASQYLEVLTNELSCRLFWSFVGYLEHQRQEHLHSVVEQAQGWESIGLGSFYVSMSSRNI